MNDIDWIELILLMLKIYMSNFNINMSNAATQQQCNMIF